MAKKRTGRAGPLASQRAYPRLTLDDRRGIERGLDKGDSAREIARRLGRQPSTVTREVRWNRVYAAPRDLAGERFPEEAPEGACDRVKGSLRVCNGCNKRRCGCSRKLNLNLPHSR